MITLPQGTTLPFKSNAVTEVQTRGFFTSQGYTQQKIAEVVGNTQKT